MNSYENEIELEYECIKWKHCKYVTFETYETKLDLLLDSQYVSDLIPSLAEWETSTNLRGGYARHTW